MSTLVGICGGTGSGKTTLAAKVVDQLNTSRGAEAASTISFDSYYVDQSAKSEIERQGVNYDHPSSLDGQLLAQHLSELSAGNAVAVPVYDFATHTRSSEVRLLEPADVIVVEGILIYAFPDIRSRLDFRVFRRCPEPIRFARRFERDLTERGRSEASIAEQLASTVMPMHDEFVEPSAQFADLVTDHHQELDVVAELVVERIVALSADRSRSQPAG